ncbi:GNAT family N-acetyltransferase [Actinoplanes palleronii]|uniref:N-acetyltransferase domain-containing protein n=1 Tax=Actinoplanes palleronii TaxID=113570 RepID=A0ABQ4B5H2_9ACTN|nr:GNAT family N-acetyltransferase [Actinoplanes palleronii]GIE65903.1 hypothetical protein Apa02nite_020110 [Actinoplanes palleronii]
MKVEADRIAAAWLDANVRLVRATPLGWHAEQSDATALVSQSGLPSLNLAVSLSTSPDLGALDTMASKVAGRYGLTDRGAINVMACPAGEAMLTAQPQHLATIRQVTSAEAGEYTAALAAGFEFPAESLGPLMGGAVLDRLTGYLAGPPGFAEGTAFGIAGPGAIGVYNIAVTPRARGRGLGRALTVRVMRDGFAAGAEFAYLHASGSGLALYESMGFRHVESWSLFTAPRS